LECLGLKLYVKNPANRLPTVTTVEVPAGVVWSDVTAFLMKKYNVEIAGGLGPSVGKVFRIGLMGHNARPGNVELVLAGARLRLRSAGFSVACAAVTRLRAVC
jgi:alanine-glyoxylate transaminase/serine-glyoxylate transaminase/serine-pyruvate transaminase